MDFGPPPLTPETRKARLEDEHQLPGVGAPGGPESAPLGLGKGLRMGKMQCVTEGIIRK